jgi:aryl-alcohol dehydrogenase-like predicted oxidoreductase
LAQDHRFTSENFGAICASSTGQAVAAEAGAPPAQIALAWLLAQGDDSPRYPAQARARVERTPPPTASR